MPPCREAASATARATSSGRVTSAVTTLLREPTLRAATASGASSRSTRTTMAPSDAKSSAARLPIMPPAPVIMATRSSSLPMAVSSAVCRPLHPAVQNRVPPPPEMPAPRVASWLQVGPRKGGLSMQLRALAGTAATIVFLSGSLASAGVTTTTLVDGSTSTTLIDGSTSTTLVDGTTTTTLIDGSTSTTLVDGSTTTTLVNGSTSTTLVDGSTTTTVIGGSTTSSTLPGGQTSAHDALFVLEASLANLGEIESGQLMSEAGQHPDVRAYGTQMVTEHCAHLIQLQDAADAAGIAPPRALDVTPCDDASPNGAFVTPSRDADITYVRGQIPGHRKALDLYNPQARFRRDQGLASLGEP